MTDFLALSTGAEGGHIYLKSKIDYNGQKRELVIYFSKKSDEQKTKDLRKIKVRGKIVNEGLGHSLSLFETVLLNK